MVNHHAYTRSSPEITRNNVGRPGGVLRLFRKKLVDALVATTFRDVVLLPGWSEVEPAAVKVESWASRRVRVKVPFVSSPMESVTGTAMAVAMARVGGLGVLHRNCSVEEQASMVGRVKGEEVNMDTWPQATLDEEGRLAVGAATSPHDMKRVKRLLGAGADVLVVDVAHFHTRSCFSGAARILKECPVDVVVGNIGTYEAAADVLSQLEGVGGLRCGIGSGSTCTTSVQTRVASPTLFAVASAADAARDLGASIPIIADGGVRNPGDAAVALAVGAWTVMLGSVLAGAEESPSPTEVIGGRVFKRHWGMGSERARAKRFALDRYSRPSKGLTEGVEGLVPLRGRVDEVIGEFVEALRAAGGYVGARNIPEMWRRARLARVSPAGVQELRPHSLMRIDERVKNII